MVFVDYLLEHPELIASSILFVLTLILMFIKRRPKSLDEFVMLLDDVCKSIPEWTSAVESPGNGVQKREKVISLGLSAMANAMKRPLTDRECAVCRITFSDQIEKVLDAPHRKEAI